VYHSNRWGRVGECGRSSDAWPGAVPACGGRAGAVCNHVSSDQAREPCNLWTYKITMGVRGGGVAADELIVKTKPKGQAAIAGVVVARIFGSSLRAYHCTQPVHLDQEIISHSKHVNSLIYIILLYLLRSSSLCPMRFCQLP
jgi:hypothetical protein